MKPILRIETIFFRRSYLLMIQNCAFLNLISPRSHPASVKRAVTGCGPPKLSNSGLVIRLTPRCVASVSTFQLFIQPPNLAVTWPEFQFDDTEMKLGWATELSPPFTEELRAASPALKQTFVNDICLLEIGTQLGLPWWSSG